MSENPLVVVSQVLTSPEMQKEIQHVLPAEVPLDRFTQVTMMAIRQSPEVLQADRQTLYDACLQLARRGLMPDKKEAALVVFSTKSGNDWVKKVQALPMVEGIIKEMGNAGVRAYAVSVYEKDAIKIWNDDHGQHVMHTPNLFGDRGKRVGAFASGCTGEGRTYVEAMNMEDLERIAMRSKQAKKDNNGRPVARGGTWASDPERMEQKTVLHRLRRRIPMLIGTGEEDGEIELSAHPDDAPVSPPDPSAQQSPPDKPPAEQPQRSGARRPRSLQAVVDQAGADYVPLSDEDDDSFEDVI